MQKKSREWRNLPAVLCIHFMTSSPLRAISVIESLSRFISFYNLQTWLFLFDLRHIVLITSQTASLQLFFLFVSFVLLFFMLFWTCIFLFYPCGFCPTLDFLPSSSSWVHNSFPKCSCLWQLSPDCSQQSPLCGPVDDCWGFKWSTCKMIWASCAPAGLLLLLLNTCSWLWC